MGPSESGSLRLDAGSGAATGHITIDATTADTGNAKRDKKMHTKVLRTDEFSRIVFKPDRLEGELALLGTHDVILHGSMEILGESHEIGIPLTISIDDARFSANGAFEIPYVEWGLEDPSTFVLRVAKVVVVTIEAEGTIEIIEEKPS
jgi:polyisoprenoid-binding protein YceI